MTQVELLGELKKLAIPERLALVEVLLRLIREDLEQGKEALSYAEKEHRLAAAARSLLPDYAVGGELTIFTALDGEDFHAQG